MLDFIELGMDIISVEILIAVSGEETSQCWT